LAAPDASASDLYDYDPNVPNGTVNSCLTCHTTLEGIDLNSFGLDVQNHKAGDTVPPDWAAVCGLDSDVDGQTNGQELGDPCCEWQTGQPAPRTTDVSNPGDGTDISANPDAPGCSTEDDDDGCSVSSGPVDGAGGVAGLLVVLGLVGSRRLRRQHRH
jgi:MYXO-CTERM domain-containing protein